MSTFTKVESVLRSLERLVGLMWDKFWEGLEWLVGAAVFSACTGVVLLMLAVLADKLFMFFSDGAMDLMRWL